MNIRLQTRAAEDLWGSQLLPSKLNPLYMPSGRDCSHSWFQKYSDLRSVFSLRRGKIRPEHGIERRNPRIRFSALIIYTEVDSTKWGIWKVISFSSPLWEKKKRPPSLLLPPSLPEDKNSSPGVVIVVHPLILKRIFWQGRLPLQQRKREKIMLATINVDNFFISFSKRIRPVF